MKIPVLSSYLDDFQICRKMTLSRGFQWSAWGKFFFAVGWWTTALLKLILMPLALSLFLIFIIGNLANWLLERLAQVILFPRTQAREKHVLQPK